MQQRVQDTLDERSEPGRSAEPALRNVVGSGWLPVGLLVAGTALTLRYYGVSFGSTAAFLGYVALGITLPGTLIWRAVHRGRGWFAADVAAGTALGYAGEVLTYIPARFAGLPLLVLAWPVGTVVAFLAVPKLRRYWRGAPDGDRPPAAWNWSLAGAAALIVFWSAKFYRVYGLAWPFNSTPDTDSPFHLAYVGEAKHHMPMAVPWVSGEPVYYHWFVYAEMAATSWVTGIEPQILLLRLSMLPMLVAFTVLVAVLARRLFGTWWTGVAAVVGTLFVLAPDPYGWAATDFYTNLGFSTVDDGSALRLTVWTSPTQTFGAVLFAALALVLVDLLTGHGGPARWVLFAVLVGAITGAKAVYLPMTLAALLLVITVRLVFRRELHRPALAAAGLVLAGVLFTQFVLFGNTGAGLRLEPLRSVGTTAVGISTAFLDKPPLWRFTLVALLTVWCWCCIWFGITGLVRRRQRLLEPEVLLLLGLGIAGAAGGILFVQSGDGQLYFLESARPYLALAAVGGLAAVLPAPLDARRALAIASAALAGGAVIWIVQTVDGPRVPAIWVLHSYKRVALAITWPYLATVAAAGLALAGLIVLRRRVPALRGISHALLVALLAGFGLATTAANFGRIVTDASASGWRDVVRPNVRLVTDGTVEAGRWLRDHSSPDDLVATNAHCVPLEPPKCSSLHFSVAAYTERRMLVEGWGFTSTAHVRADATHTWVGYVPYWKPDVLAANDAAFSAPSAATIGTLRDRYGVRWLFVDETQSRPSPDLGRFATERYRAGDCVVYQLSP